mmetsp:Transcript_62196/g.182363  ORF Transcript_62196/g.182363 Transcript_62196/m.182363 type:complete len:166 (-) Transcript_62196:296-793(-)
MASLRRSSGAGTDEPPAKRAKCVPTPSFPGTGHIGCRCIREPSAKRLENLLAVTPPGPVDFGGRIAQLLWGVHLQYRPVVDILLLKWGSVEDHRQLKGAKRVERPEINALLRCSRSVRQGTIAAAQARMATLDEGAPEAEQKDLLELCDSLREKYPSTWECVKAC